MCRKSVLHYDARLDCISVANADGKRNVFLLNGKVTAVLKKKKKKLLQAFQ
jgi:hypothetical protein